MTATIVPLPNTGTTHGRAIAPADIKVGMTISINPAEPPFTVHRFEESTYFFYAWDRAGMPRAISPDAWVAVVSA